MEVTTDTIFGELLEEYPETEEVLKDYLGAAYCLVCPGKMYDTIGNGALLHGLSDNTTENMVEDLQSIVDSYEKGEVSTYEPHVIDKGMAHDDVAVSHDGHVHTPGDGHDHGDEASHEAETDTTDDIDTSAVNIDHMFDAARAELEAQEREDAQRAKSTTGQAAHGIADEHEPDDQDLNT